MVEATAAGYGTAMSETTTCPWCSSTIPAGASRCPSCNATVEGAATPEILGVAEPSPKPPLPPDAGIVPEAIDPVAILREERAQEAENPAAFAPPSDAVRQEMRKMELAAQILNAGETVMNPGSDMANDVGRPSRQALEAAREGLLDDAVPPSEEQALHERTFTWVEEEGLTGPDQEPGKTPDQA
jgi:hypothetical protein